MREHHIRIRTTEETVKKIDELIEHYQENSINKITKTNIIELAIRELHKEMKGDK